MEDQNIQQLLRQVAWRQRLVAIGKRSYLFTLIFAALFAATLVILRVLGTPHAFVSWWTIGAVPLLGILLALLWHPKPTSNQTARLIDQKTASKDLFLTATTLGQSMGDYQAMVASEATDRAKTVQPQQMVALEGGWPRFFNTMIALVVLLAGVLWFPQFDVLGVQAQQQKTAQRKERLEETKKAVAKRADELKKQDVTTPLSKPVEAKLNALKRTFNRMKPKDPKGNAQKLAARKDQLQEAWKQKKLAQALQNQSVSQRFGAMSNPQSRKWQKDLKQGKTSDLEKKLNKLKDQAPQLAKETDPAKRQELQQQMQQSMQDMADFAMKQDGGSKLSEAMNQALQQLDMASMKEMSKEAMEALQESLDLSEKEMQQLAQNARDMKSLQDAMKALQQAQELNQIQPLDGKASSSCKTMADYKKLYQQQLSQCKSGGKNGNKPGNGQGAGGAGGASPSLAQGQNGQGQGQGQGSGQGGFGGQGQGQGGIAPEDDSIKTDFQLKRDKPHLQAGKILLTWKTKGLAQPGEATDDYQSSVQTIQQNTSQAIQAEQVPSGYHGAIKKYFDTIEKTVEAPQTPPPETSPTPSP